MDEQASSRASDADTPTKGDKISPDTPTKGDKSRHFRPTQLVTSPELGVLVELAPATHDEIERMARTTGVGARRMLERLIEHGMNRWHEARQAGRLTSLW